MAQTVAQLVQALTKDTRREAGGFTQDLETATVEILDPSKSDAERAAALAKWLGKNQPCLFGRMAAGPHNLLTYCILTEADIDQGDRHIRDKIQSYRLNWRREALLGRKSGFVILAASGRLTFAEPNEALMAVALRLCSLYLREDIIPDRVHHERLTLEIPGGASPDNEPGWYEWRVGVNFFAAAGDKRWWHDHRIPGGIAFSMNSVGHMARSGALHNMAAQSGTGGVPQKGKLAVDSLGNALKFAMLTINNAQDTDSGKATCLRDLTPESYGALTPKCPFTPPPNLALKDYTGYDGWYDTDATVPADYFHPDVRRPGSVHERNLNFTYLFDDSIDNPDYDTMGPGGRTR